MNKQSAIYWTEEQIQILKNLFSITDTTEIAKKIGKSPIATKAKALRLGLSKFVEEIPEGFKKCPHCNQIISLDKFYANQSWCKACLKEERNEWGQRNKEHLAEYRFIRIARNPNHMQEISVQGTHKYRALIKEGHNLTQKEWQEILEKYHQICPACGMSFTEKNPATRDCILPVSKGGLLTKDNVQPLHHACNVKKLNQTVRYSIKEQNCKGKYYA